MDGVQPRDIRGRAGGGLFQLSGGGAVRVISITIAHNIYFFYLTINTSEIQTSRRPRFTTRYCR